ncbi:hypothetical protein HK104_007971, partial [Borealophlyctis nickersoniae]
PTLPISSHKDITKNVARILRLESTAEDILTSLASTSTSSTVFKDFTTAFRSAIDPLPENVVGFKSIAAYRSGLNIVPSSDFASVSRVVAKLVEEIRGKKEGWRLVEKEVVDYVVCVGVEVAGKWGVPVQVHTGVGDKDLDLLQANPLLLRNLLNHPISAKTKIVLLHVYPYAREAGYLASVYDQVYVDFGEADLILSSDGKAPFLQVLMASFTKFWLKKFGLAHID